MANMKSANRNPAGRGGKPFSLYPHSFDEVVDKMLSTPPPPKTDVEPQKRRAKKTAHKRQSAKSK
jgi:hypothetical protein